MAELYQTQWNEIKSRQSGADLALLIQLLDSDGNITIEDDPTEDEILAAREKAASDAQAAQEKAESEAQKAAEETEKERQASADVEATQRIAALPHPDDNPPPVVEGQETSATEADEEVKDEKKGNGRSKG